MTALGDEPGVSYLVIDRHDVDCQVVRICPARSLLSRA
jgi:hypothetical protein